MLVSEIEIWADVDFRANQELEYVSLCLECCLFLSSAQTARGFYGLATLVSART